MYIAAFYESQPFMNWRDDINIWWFINHFLWLNGRSGNTAGLALCPYMEFQCSKLSKTTTCRGAHGELDDYNTVFLKRKLWVLISMKTLNWLHSGACSFILQACSGCCWGAAGVLCCPWGVGRLWIRMLQGNSRGTDTKRLWLKVQEVTWTFFTELHQMWWPLLNSPMHPHAREPGNGPKFVYSMFTKQLHPWKGESEPRNEISYEKWIYSIYIALPSSLKQGAVYHS